MSRLLPMCRLLPTWLVMPLVRVWPLLLPKLWPWLKLSILVPLLVVVAEKSTVAYVIHVSVVAYVPPMYVNVSNAA